MPTRIASTRSSRPPSSSGRKASATLTGTRTVSVAAPPFTFADADENTLRPKVCAIFRDAQRNVATHRKLVVNLRKIHETCCYETAGQTTEASHEFDEETFNKEFIRCVLRGMPVKKTESVGEKTIKFIGFFLRHASDKDYELAGEVEGDMVPETPTSRLITQLLEAVIPLMSVKDKFVRYRSTQLLSQIVNSLDALDDELYHNLRQSLLRRVRDKEAMVRVQAVLGLGRLAGNQSDGASNSENDDDKDGSGLLEKLLQVLQNDPSADVRRSLLVNLPILPNTLPFLLERARDQDAATRRAVYARLLPALGDFRHLSLSMREKLLRWGMRDRDENVRKAAGKLFRERWIEDCAGTVNPEESVPNFDGLLELLERIDVINSGVENGVALEAMNGFWEGRGDYRDAVNFDDEFWETLSAEAAFLARSLNDFCRAEGNRKYESLIEEKMPEVTRLAFYLERYLNALIDTSKRVQANELEEDEEDLTVEQEFIVEQLLHIALSLDYSDEVGRRKMFTLLRQSLSIPELPDQVTKLTIEVLYYICSPDAAGEREFCSIVLESVADVHDTIVDDPTDDVEDSFHSARSEVSGLSTPTKGGRKAMNAEDARERAVKEIVINMKCLHIVQCMLTHIVGHLKDNADLVSMLNNLVVPAVRSHEAPVRERGLVCLGLCALQDRSLAEENLGLFIHFFNKGHAALQITALHILTDILNVHGAHLFSSTPALLKVYVKAVKSSAKSSDVQAAAIMATSKLLLGRVVTDEEACQELLKSLVIAYFDPVSASNQTVRQALNYFLPVFCYSRSSNQDLMRSISLVVLHSLLNLRDGLEDDDEADVDEDMMGMATIGACLVDWTDPRKCYGATNLLEPEKKHVNGDVHLDFALDILDRLHTNISKEEKKLIAGLFSKLYVSPESSQDKLREAYEDISVAVDDGLCADATSRNSLYKIHVSLGKIVNALDEQQPGRGQRTASGTQAAGPGSEGKAGSVEPSIKDEDDLDGDSNGTVIARYDRSSTIGEMSATALSAAGQDTEMGDDSI